MIPSWLRRHLSEKDLGTIESQVAEVEKMTSGEIVPMVVRRSSTVGHVPVVLFCGFFLLFFATGLAELQRDVLGAESPLWWLLNALLFSGVSLALARLPFVQRHLISQEDIDHQVSQRAQLEFYQAQLRQTEGRTGVLIFLSLMEHRVVVLADSSIASKLPPKTWKDVVELLVGGVKKGSMTDGFCQALTKCGEVLAPQFPIQDGDQNELRNHLLIKE